MSATNKKRIGFAASVGVIAGFVTIIFMLGTSSIPKDSWRTVATFFEYLNAFWMVLNIPAYMVAMQIFLTEENMKPLVVTLVIIQWFIIGYVISFFRFRADSPIS